MKKAMLIVGILGFLFCGAVGVFFIILPSFSHTSIEEAAPGIGGGCCCSLIFLVMAIVGLVMTMKAKKAAQQGGPDGPKV